MRQKRVGNFFFYFCRDGAIASTTTSFFSTNLSSWRYLRFNDFLSSSPTLLYIASHFTYCRSHAMALQQAEKDLFGIQIMQELSQTPYACSSLTVMHGGTANFLFRGVLASPLPNGTKTIVLKHSKEFISANRNFQLDISRCVRSPFCASIIRDSEQKYTGA